MNNPFQWYQFSELWLPEMKYLLVCLPLPVQIHQAVLIKFLHCKNTILNHSKIDKGEVFYIYKLDLDQEENILHQMKNKAGKKSVIKDLRRGKSFSVVAPASAVFVLWTFLSVY